MPRRMIKVRPRDYLGQQVHRLLGAFEQPCQVRAKASFTDDVYQFVNFC